MNKKLVIGIDFGTLSARGVLADGITGERLASSSFEYPHGVMTAESGGTSALQHPGDYLVALKHTISEILRKSGASASEVCGVGIDFTACTLMPIMADGTPLCFLPEYNNRPHAYAKLWKHHGAQKEAELINKTAKERGEEWLMRYGGSVSCEWALPKILEVLRCDEDIFYNTDRFIEAGDWISYMLTGRESHSAVFAGIKALYSKKHGFPSDSFFTSVDPALHGLIGTRLSDDISSVNETAGFVSKSGSELSCLAQGTAVALPIIDGHAPLPALKIMGEGDMLLVLGTSSCHIINSAEECTIPGICGVTDDGAIPGMYTYEAGQSCCGDHFDWFVKNCVPSRYEDEARKRGVSIHALLREAAKRLKAGQSGLLALDWWNGNRSTLNDASLSGMIMGLTLNTRPEEIYRTLIEATAFGTRAILENYTSHGIAIKSICATGGIAERDDMLMQIYADVTGYEIRVAAMPDATAYGSALYGAVAAGIYPDIHAASDALGSSDGRIYKPQSESSRIYDMLYREYKGLYDTFGRGGNDVMKKLRDIRENTAKAHPGS